MSCWGRHERLLERARRHPRHGARDAHLVGALALVRPMIRLVGVDPGLSGAIAALDLHHDGELPVLVSVVPTPTLTYSTRKKTRRDYDVPAMYRMPRAPDPTGTRAVAP